MKFNLRILWGDIHEDGNVFYWLEDIDGKKVQFNDFVGKKITIKDTGERKCRICGEKVNQTYQKGSCTKCFREHPRCDICMVRPELCHFEEGTCRDEDFARQWCFNDQFVYFAVTNDLKVGYMSKENKPQRWVDQGATKAILFAKLPTRKEAGDLEKYLSGYVKDKTSWAKMVKGEAKEVDLKKTSEYWSGKVPKKWQKYVLKNERVFDLKYPIKKYPGKVSRLRIDNNEISEILYGIKGQYLLFKDKVLSLRAYEGYIIELKVSEPSFEELAEQGSLF